jgi:hypothetical protein
MSSLPLQKTASQPVPQTGLDAASAELVTLTISWTDAINAKDQAKLLTPGDTVVVLGQHFAPSAKELRERTRKIMASRDGIEKRVAGRRSYCTPTPTAGEGAMKIQRLVADESVSRILLPRGR